MHVFLIIYLTNSHKKYLFIFVRILLESDILTHTHIHIADIYIIVYLILNQFKKKSILV